MIKGFEVLLPVVMAQEGMKAQFEAEARRLPDAKTLEKILRYETTIKKHLYRAMDQLERLQRHRKGEFAPPPVKLAVIDEY